MTAQGLDIRILPAGELDAGRWNHRVRSGLGGGMFSSAPYLNNMAPAWAGLVVGDYEAVLPLPYKSKFGLRYLAALPFVRQQGLTGVLPSAAGSLAAVFKAIHGFARYGDLCFNYSNGVLFKDVLKVSTKDSPVICQGGQVSLRPNFEIDLQRDYGSIQAGYHKSFQARIQKMERKAALEMQPADRHAVAAAYERFLKEEKGVSLPEDFRRLNLLLDTDFGREHFYGYRVLDRAQGRAVLWGLYGKDDHRIYHFMTAVSAEGRRLRASACAVDQLIRNFAGERMVFDFMGSNLPGVRRFIEAFGAGNNPYYLYHFNHLPWPLRLLKK